MILFSIVSYFQIKLVQSNLAVTLFSSYGIANGGKFFVNITSCNSNKIFVGLSTLQQVEELWDPAFNYSEVCLRPMNYFFTIFNTTLVSDKNYTFSATIEYEGVVNPIFIMCDKNNIDINTTIVFQNPKSYLDTRHELLLVTTPLHGIMYFVTLACLIFVLITKAAIFMKFHILLIVTLLSLCLNMFTEFWVYLSEMKSPFLSSAYWVHYSFNFIGTTLIFNVLTLSAGGWQIHTVRFGLASYLFSLFSGLSFAATEIIPIFVLRLEPDLISYGIKLLALICVAKVTVVELRTCEQYLQSYALIVDSVGIDHNTTPLRRRIIMQYVFLCTIVIYFLCQIVILHIPMYVPTMQPWILSVVTHGINNLLFIAISINYMPWRQKKCDWYATFDDEDKLIDCAMEDFNPESYQSNKKPIKWESGSKIPLPPLIATTEYRTSFDEINDKELPLIEKPSL